MYPFLPYPRRPSIATQSVSARVIAMQPSNATVPSNVHSPLEIVKAKYDRMKDKYRRRTNHDNDGGPSASTGPAHTTHVECKEIAFHHAGYDPDSQNTVISRLKGSVDYNGHVRAPIAWMILRNLVDIDTFQRLRFSCTRGKNLSDLIPDGHLKATNYYIHSPDPDNTDDVLYRFPLTPCFETWTHEERVPQSWFEDRNLSIFDKTSTLPKVIRNTSGLELQRVCNKAVIKRDKNCILSNAAGTVCERAYLVPKNEQHVWMAEGMSTHIASSRFSDASWDIHHPLNGITLRPDLHRSYNNGDFVFLLLGNHWVAHFFDPMSPLGKVFDQKTIRLSKEIPRIYLMARLAIAAFALAKDFLEQDKAGSTAAALNLVQEG
jgi:hypothetical protein